MFTDQSGANTQIDQDNWFVWTFSVTDGNTVDDILGSFVIKRGPSTSEPIVFSLFDDDASAWTFATIMGTTPLTAYSKAAADVDNSYGTELFPLDPTPDLTDAVDLYSLVLWSNTTTNGAYQFFFKGERNQPLLVDPCGIIDGSNVDCPTPEQLGEAPEPSTVILTLSGLAFVAYRRWRR